MASLGTLVDPKDPRVLYVVHKTLGRIALRVNLTTGKWEVVDKNGTVTQIG